MLDVRICVAAAVVCLLAATGCKGKTEYKDRPETLRILKDCETDNAAKNAYIERLKNENADLKLKGGGDAVLVKIEGDELVISGKGPNGRVNVEKGDAKDNDLYDAFVKAVRRSRGRIKKCYTAALKNNANLQARTVTLKIAVDYRTDGQVRNALFSPRIPGFDKCIRNVAKGWKLPAMPKSVSFEHKMSLTPE
jgi:hypothetical protein